MQSTENSRLLLNLYDPIKNTYHNYTYDNIHLKIYDENSKVVSTDHLKPLLSKAKIHDCKIRVSDKPHWYKSNKPRHIRITLGQNCNFRCKYCIQHHTEDLFPDDNVLNVNTLIDVYSKYLDLSDVEMIQFWGGEPLLYKNTILSATKALKHIVPHSTKIYALSNGSLWDDEFISACLEVGLQLGLSHDGPGQYLRSKDPLAKDTKSRDAILRYWNAIKDIEENNFSILCTATNASLADITATDKYFINTFGEKIKGRYNYKCLIVENEEQKKYMLDTSRNAKIPFKIFTHLFNKKLDGNGFGLNVIDTLQLFTNEQFGINLDRVTCFLSSANVLVTDLLGNVYPCQNYCSKDRIMGHISNLEHLNIPKYNVLSNKRTQCIHCPVLAMCMGGCPLVDYEYLNDNCKSQFVFNIGILSYVIYLITGKVLISIDGDFPCRNI